MRYSTEWSDVINPDRSNIVFENRNKEYGGYALRRDYHRRVIFAFTITLTGLGLLVSAPLLISLLSETENQIVIKNNERIKFEDFSTIEKLISPTTSVTPQQSHQKSVRSTVPIVVNERVTDLPPTQDATLTTQVSTVTQDGDVFADVPSEPVAEPETIYSIGGVEEMPSFPGGEANLFKYLSKIKYPAIARENGIQGRVYISFIIDKDGKIKDAKILRGIGGGCDEEALNVVIALPDWKPGRQNGRNVSVLYNLPINFSLK